MVTCSLLGGGGMLIGPHDLIMYKIQLKNKFIRANLHVYSY